MSVSIASIRFADPRLLVLYGCCWLLGSWGWMLWQDGAVASVRWMTLNAMIGLMLVWPVWRLSQPTEPIEKTTRVVLTDWLCLELLIQITIWPLRLTADWSLIRTISIATVLAIWPLMTAGIVAWAWSRQHRSLGMIACALLLFAWPIAEAWGMLPSSVAHWSPLALLWNLSAPAVDFP